MEPIKPSTKTTRRSSTQRHIGVAPIEEPGRKAGPLEGIRTTEAVFHLINGILGVGVLGYPFAFKECGAVLGTLLVCGILLACLFSVRILLISSQLSGKRTYEELAAYAFGKWGHGIVNFAIVVLNLGAIVAYLNIIADVLSSVAGTVVPPGAEPSRNSVIFGVTMVGVLPIALLVQDAGSMAWVSSFSVGYIFVFALLMLVRGLNIPSEETTDISYWETKGILVAFPVMAYGFIVHTILFPVYAFLHSPTTKRMTRAVSRAMVICSLVYLAVGYGGYMAFGQRTSGDILRNLGGQEKTGMRGIYERIVKVGYGLNILGTVPLVVLPMQSVLVPMVATLMKDAGVRKCDHATEKRLISTAAIGLSYGLAMVLPNVEFILGLNGAINGVLLAYIMPSLIYLKVTSTAGGSQVQRVQGDGARNSHGWTKAKAVLLLIFGIFAGIFCTSATLRAVDRENTVVELVQQYLMGSKHVENARAAEERARHVVITVNTVKNATANLGGAQSDAVESLKTVRDSADALSSTLSAADRKDIGLWDVQGQIKQLGQKNQERATINMVLKNLAEVKERLSGTLESVKDIKKDLDNAQRKVQANNVTQTQEKPAGEVELGEIAEQLASALGVPSAKKDEMSSSAHVTIQTLQKEVDSAIAALEQTIHILGEVEDVIKDAQKHGTNDGQIQQRAVEAMHLAVNATESSALALQLTDGALHDAASNQTSELLQVLSTVVEGKDGAVKAKPAWDFGITGSIGAADTSGSSSGSDQSNQGEGVETQSRPIGQLGEPDIKTNGDEKKKEAEAVIKEVAKIKGGSDTVTTIDGSKSDLNVSALSKAAEAAYGLAGSSKDDAIQEQHKNRQTVDPEIAAEAQEIVEELEKGDSSGETASNGTDASLKT